MEQAIGNAPYVAPQTLLIVDDDAINRGIQVIYQDFAVFPNLTVAENLFVDRFPRRGLSVDNKKMEERAQVYIDLFRLDISPRTRVESLPMGVRWITL